ncbi:helix-turn-helix transcriptional regulator [Leucobacter sp. UT-8R-CII-1-4]|uniref:helix-turn-helix transcriptional regulator n=1 Tax=Leucobacter sp. UT-8R-CII-1-4 TaxID=3040075 RepID=UPI0024A90FCF|nr:helix-turn-helix transcriptional regulator [Leucobacter sp. UT-8R-CII-1-4]MDI6022618.1 helix-turn-helix transcriptional regulator [Leucobacter sp. UT-8R-CII-1-4]
MPRDELLDQLTLELAQTDAVLVIGPRQSGKKHALDAFAARLDESQSQHCVIAHNDPKALDLVRAARPGQILLFNNLELADAEMLRALADQVAAGVKVVGTLGTDEDTRTYDEVIRDLSTSAHPAASALAQTQNLRLSPLSQEQAERLAHSKQLVPLDSVTIGAIAQLSWGRPGWLIDLLKLAASGKVLADPLPQIKGVNSSDMHLPALSFASRAAKTHLEQESIAAAIVLSKLDARTLDGATHLVGNEHVLALRNAGILVTNSANSGLYGVPEIYAAALEPHVDLALLGRTASASASVLLMQESIGIAISMRESVFCAWAYEPQTIATETIDHSHQRTNQVHSRIATQTASVLLLFGRTESRDLMLRASAATSFSDINRVRAATIFRGPIEGLRTFRSVLEETAAEQNSEALGAARTPEAQLSLDFLHQQLIAAHDGTTTQTGPLNLGSMQSTQKHQQPGDNNTINAKRVFARLNDALPLGEDAPAIFEAACSHPVFEVALLAEQLFALDQLRLGVQPSPHFTQAGSAGRIAGAKHTTSRFHRISGLAVSGTDELHDLLATAAVTEAIISLLTAEHTSAVEELQHTVARLPGALLHSIWARHFTAAVTAIAAGDTPRAVLEWQLLSKALPYFLPQRVRTLVSEIGEELSEKGNGGHSESRHFMLDYVLGDFDAIRLPKHSNLARAKGAPPSSPLPIYRLISAHLSAREAQNPVALQRIAQVLQAQHLWAPAAYALLNARAIFLRRRATGSVTYCNGLIESLNEQARRYAPWFTAEALEPPRTVRLTRRETSVTQLCAEGLSNRQIAERLEVSIRTVESHLASARAKLGAGRRAQLAERFQELVKLTAT